VGGGFQVESLARSLLRVGVNIAMLGALSEVQRRILDQYWLTFAWSTGQTVPREPRGLWLILEGEVSFGTGPRRGYPGDFFDEEELWQNPEAPPPARQAVTARKDCVLAQLSPSAYRKMCAAHPEVGLAFLHALLRKKQESETAAGPGHMPPSEHSVALENAADDAIPEKFTLIVSGTSTTVSRGTRLLELLPEKLDGLPVVAALVDNKALSLSSMATAGSRVEPMTTHVWEGQRIQRQSMALLTLEAAYELSPSTHVKMGPSVGFGQRIFAKGFSPRELEEFGQRLEQRIHELARRGRSLREEVWTLEQAHTYFSTLGHIEADELLATWRHSAVAVQSYGSVYALEMGPLLPNSKGLDSCHVLCDGELLLLVYGTRPHHPQRLTQLMPARALSDVGEREPQTATLTTSGFILGQAHTALGSSYDVNTEEQAWLNTLNVASIGTFNRACVTGNVPELIRVAEGFQEKRLTLIADEIHRRKHEIEVVCIAGPSSSGKSTFIRRLCVQLQINGINPVALGLDDYYVDRNNTPLTRDGNYDFEALGALQLPLLHEHLRRLLAGEAVQTPRYDFVSGESRKNGGRALKLNPRDILLLEGIHGLNPELLGEVPSTHVFRIFVCPLLQLSFDHLTRAQASDVRLIRRIVRDRHTRGIAAKDTIERWPQVRAGERQHIYPYQTHANAVFDSSLLYELSVQRVYAERYLLEVPRNHPSYLTAFRLIHLLDHFVSIYPEQVPANSILREFIGGSAFES
jgi:uridine kinase